MRDRGRTVMGVSSRGMCELIRQGERKVVRVERNMVMNE